MLCYPRYDGIYIGGALKAMDSIITLYCEFVYIDHQHM